MHCIALIALIAVHAGSAISHAAGLQIENTVSGRVFELNTAPEHRFSIIYHHSIYDAPVIEEFSIDDERIVLTAVASPSAAAREYFGLTEAGERHRLTREFEDIYLRIAIGEPSRLQIGGREFSFREFGAPGDRLRLSPLLQ
jgi:hypothetical protein